MKAALLLCVLVATVGFACCSISVHLRAYRSVRELCFGLAAWAAWSGIGYVFFRSLMSIGTR